MNASEWIDDMKTQMMNLALLGLLTACGGHAPEGAGAELKLPEGPARTVQVVKAEKVTHQATEEVVGTVRSKQRAMVEAKVSGRVEQYLVVPGQVVKAGELLVQLDVREIATKVDSAKALLEQADRELARFKQLVSQNAATRQELDAVEARQKVAAAQVTEAETMLSYARVAAPFDGVVTRKLAEVGDLAMPGKPLAEVESPKGLRFEADLPEAILDRVKMGQKMTATIGGVTAEAVVSEIAPIADAVSRTFRVKMDLAEREGLRTGQFGRVAVPVAETQVLAVPTSAVVKRGQLEGVFVVMDGRAWLRLVKTGRKVAGGVEILSGLEVGEEIVLEAMAAMKDGQPVEVKA
jgi:RND family efflux transporter MFP subunit